MRKGCVTITNNNMIFVKKNVNPVEKKTNDCVVRAITVAESSTWEEVYKELCDKGAEMFSMPNAKGTYEAYLFSKGWVKQKMPKNQLGRRVKVKDFVDENTNKIILINVVGHVTVAVYGKLYDTWDCSSKCVGNYYTK